MTAYHQSLYCDLIHNEDATNQNETFLLNAKLGINIS
jgi:hypothetical protein